MAPWLRDCVFDAWQPGIGDPTVMGWLTVLAYLAVFWLALRIAATPARFPPETRGREALLWAGIAGLLLLLAINKQLDLQTFVTVAGKCIALHDGWYAQRRAVQAAVLAGIGLAAAATLLLAARMLSGTLRREGLALLGLVLLAGFVMTRAVSFHAFDTVIGSRLAGWRLNWVFELGALALLALGALRVLALPARRGAADPHGARPPSPGG